MARGARVDGQRVLLTLSDGAEVPLDPETLTIDGAGVIRCLVRGGALEARLATAAVAALAEVIDDSVSPPALVLGSRSFPMRTRKEEARS